MVVEDVVVGTRGGHAVACVGDAAKAGAGDHNLTGEEQLLSILQQ